MVSADDRKPIFSSKMLRFLQNRLMEIFGLLLLFLGVVLLTSLLTAGKTDPSFTQISDLPVQNWFGPFGAQISAALFAAIGLAAFPMGIVPLFWGFSYMRKRSIAHFRYRAPP